MPIASAFSFPSVCDSSPPLLLSVVALAVAFCLLFVVLVGCHLLLVSDQEQSMAAPRCDVVEWDLPRSLTANQDRQSVLGVVEWKRSVKGQYLRGAVEHWLG